MLTQQALKTALHYDASTGHFTWISARTGTVIGRKAGWLAGGYVSIAIDRTTYKAHRLAWLYMTGAWPLQEIDHINGVGHDNRFENLREADDLQNSLNRKLRADSLTGYKGVCFRKDRKTRHWQARIVVDRKRKSLGFFRSAEEARAAYAKAAYKYHGQFARTA